MLNGKSNNKCNINILKCKWKNCKK